MGEDKTHCQTSEGQWKKQWCVCGGGGGGDVNERCKNKVSGHSTYPVQLSKPV